MPDAAPAAAIVTLGDSLTDGRGSTTNGNDRWPDDLSRRLRATAATARVAVLNQGIGGNAVVSGGLGPTAMERFPRDVLEQSGVRWLIVFEGVNDIGAASGSGKMAARSLINAFGGFIDAAHARKIRVYGVPITPFAGSFYDSPDHQTARRMVNDWIRTSGRFDAVIDLDAAVRDPARRARKRRASSRRVRRRRSPASEPGRLPEDGGRDRPGAVRGSVKYTARRPFWDGGELPVTSEQRRIISGRAR